MKRYTMVGATVSLALFSSVALAAPNVVNTTQKGSLLVFPEIEVGYAKNTIIRITNDNTKPIDVKCYYGEFTGYVDYKPTRDFMFTLTKNQPVYWEAKDGTGSVTIPDFPRVDDDENAGQLVCWAVSRGGGSQVKWNHLSGTATVMSSIYDFDYWLEHNSHSYNAFAFYARGAKNKARVGSTDGVLELDGTAAGGGYDKCGRYIIGHFTPTGSVIYLPGTHSGFAYSAANHLSVSACTQDLSPVGKANPLGEDGSQPFTCGGDSEPKCGHDIVIDVWNGDEVKFTGARERADSWWRIILGDYDSDYSSVDYAYENFGYDQLQTNSAYFRAESDSGYGLVGVLMSRYKDNLCYRLGKICRILPGSTLESAVTTNHAGTRAGKIIWRTQDDDPPEKM